MQEDSVNPAQTFTLSLRHAPGNNTGSVMASSNLYLQLYSLRHETAADPAGVVRQVPGLGFDGIELAADFGWAVERWRAILDETGLELLSAMAGLEALENTWAERVTYYRALGCNRLIVPGLARTLMNPGGYREAARRLNALGAELKSAGFILGFHNHAWEFEPLADGTCGMDTLLAETDPGLVRFEFDTHWLEFGGQPAVEFIRRNAARTLAIHAKDFRKRDRQDVPAGQGDVDFAGLLPLCASYEWPVILEYEGGNATEAVRCGGAYLRSLLR